MIGHLFSSRKGTNASHAASPTVLDSATEESHTRHLLYPESNTLYHPDGQPYPLHAAPLTPGSGHDGPLPEIDLDYPRDCRIIIAQDETPAMPKAILFDSKPAPPRPEPSTSPNPRARAFGGANSSTTSTASTAAPALGSLHARRSSLVTEPTAPPRSPTVGGFTRVRTRGSSISSMPNIDEHAQLQAKAQARAKESTDLANICLDCMFGNLAMNYRGNSNKIHIVPLDTRPTDSSVLGTSIQDATTSLGRAEGLRRRSHLAKSFTPANPPTDLARNDSNESIPKEPKRRTIFITRMFSVTMPEEDNDDRTPTPQSSLPKGNGFPFPASNSKPAATKPVYPSHARKSPMYAITIILHLPISQTIPSLRPSSRGTSLKNPTHLSTSAPGQESLASSLDSDRRAGWAFVDANLGVDSLFSSSLSSDVDDRVDVVGQHWDVIMRALTSLQHVVQERILAQFKSPKSPEPITPTGAQHQRSQSSRTSFREPSLQYSRRALRLQPNALMMDREIQIAAELTGNRVVSGMRIPRVMTGQGKWGVWREEARWLAPPRKQKATAGENLTISNRTVIVSPDKMAARRLIFLLAAFLPPNAPALADSAYIRPSTSTSLRAYSQSPPTNMPPSRQQSLRRQINRRGPRSKQSMSNILLQPPRPQSVHQIPVQPTHERSESAVIEAPELVRPTGHSRRSSAHSVRTSLVIPSLSEGSVTSSSTVTTSTIIPQETIPIAHFTFPRTKSFGPASETRPESSDSLASSNLISTLQRSGTGQTSLASNDSSNASRWSGFMNFWSGRRSSSTDQSEFFQTTDDGVGYRGQERSRSQLELMVQELSMDRVFESDAADSPLALDPSTDNISPDTYSNAGCPGVPASAARPIPERHKTFEGHLKLSVNEKDGVIDVDIPLPDFDSPLQSPLLGGYGSASSQPGSSFGESSVLSVPHASFHPDFAVQAIKPYRELERDIKRAMSAEPTPLSAITTPSLESGPLERWIDICSALIADTSNFSIKRITMTPGVLPGRSQYGNPYTSGTVAPMMTEVHLAEKFVTETIMDFDATLIDGVDRVLAQSGEVTRANSAQSSRSSSRRGRRDTRGDSDAIPHVEVPHIDCKSVLFEALEVVVKEVTAERKGDKRPRTALPRTENDSSLKEGIRRWLTEVE
ncbi:folliculin-interacting protein N-terminus-domain-containing protein [Bipolaris maydis]|nr:folliculin-interacting protein N-terminus-domain-containing protein [Bipolaris maydis]